MSDFKNAMTEWIELKKHLAQARKDLSLLAKREKMLSEIIKQNMIQNDVEDVKIQDSKVRMRTKNAKGGITKEVIQSGLTSYFSGDAVKVEGAMKAIVDSAPVKQRSTLSILKG
jgi:aldehyde:ferredoxin oxidoreductase